MRRGYVYAVENQGAVKIGFTTHPFVRLETFNHASPVTLALTGFIRGTQQQENALHALLKPHRIKGEWYRKEGLVLQFLETLPPPCRPEDFNPRAA